MGTHLLSALLATACALSAQPSKRVTSRPVDIFSDGTRMSGDVFAPKDLEAGASLPAILLCHGWGGVKSHLNRTYAPKFAAAGYIVLTFDYRGWGESDSRLVIEGEQPEPDERGEATVRVRVIRELVDPFDQLEDIQAALDFLEGEPGVDRDRIGIWGTSLGGGLVVWTAAHDPRVRVVVSQVGAMHGRWALEAAGSLEAIHEQEIQRARGELPPVPQGVDVRPGLRGTPHLTEFAEYSPLSHSDKLTVPTLLIDAENEDLFDRMEHSHAVYEKIKDHVVSEYHVEPGISHYGIYRERYRAASDRALKWFDEHLAADATPPAPPSARFHHVHLNVTDPGETIAFYRKYFGANGVEYRGRASALFTEKSFILLNRVAEAPPTNLGTSLWHIGWAGVDGQSEFKWRVDAGIDVQTPITRLGADSYMYFWGPSKEVIEVYTGSRNHRFEHAHLLATDVNATVAWFTEHLGLRALRRNVPRPANRTWMNIIRVDNVNLIVFGKPGPGERAPAWYPKEMKADFSETDGTAIDHLAFSYLDIAPVYERMKAAGVEIVRPLARSERFGFESFFVRGPDGLLVEIVEERPIPEGVWR